MVGRARLDDVGEVGVRLAQPDDELGTHPASPGQAGQRAHPAAPQQRAPRRLPADQPEQEQRRAVVRRLHHAPHRLQRRAAPLGAIQLVPGGAAQLDYPPAGTPGKAGRPPTERLRHRARRSARRRGRDMSGTKRRRLTVERVRVARAEPRAVCELERERDDAALFARAAEA